MEIALGLAILAFVMTVSVMLRKLDMAPTPDEQPIPITPVLVYRPRSFTEPATKGFIRDCSRYRSPFRDNDAA